MSTMGLLLVLLAAFVGIQALKTFGIGVAKPALGPAVRGQPAEAGTAGQPHEGITLPGTSGTVEGLLSQAGAPVGWIADLMRLLQLENANVNPSAVNPEAVNGENASGLWQFLPSTFNDVVRRHHLSGTNIFNPLDNTLAMLAYVADTYGTPGNIPNLWSGTYGGY